MAGMLSLKWNNHSHAFLSLLNNLLAKEQYCDATLACHGKFYPIHRMVLSTCSEYFQEIFRLTQCKHPFIIVNDIQPIDLEALLNYMYKGDVNVLQENLPSLIKAAEALKVKGLAVPDELPSDKEDGTSKKRGSSLNSYSHPKRSKTSERKGGHSSEDVASLRREIETMESSVSRVSEDEKVSYDIPTSSSAIRDDSPVEVIEPEPPSANLDPGCPPSELHTSVVKEEPFEDSYTLPITKREEVVEAFSFSESVRDDWSTNFSGNEPTDHSSMLLGTERSVESRITGYQPGTSGPCMDADHGNFPLLPGSSHFSAAPPGAIPFSTQNSPVLRKCPHCSYSSKKVTNMKRHIFAKHTGERPYACRVCPYRCVTKERLKLHLRKHTGEKPFSCSFCPFKSSSKRGVKNHSILKHLQYFD